MCDILESRTVTMKINEVVEKIIKTGTLMGCEFGDTTDDLFTPDNLVYYDSNDVEFAVGEDNNRDEWVCGLETDMTPEGTLQLLTSSLGEPSKVHDNGVRNWDIDGVLVVQSDNEIEVYEDFQKVSRVRPE
jgi:hypothetical protein